MRICIVEQEIVILIILLCSSLGFMVGSVLSPSARLERKEIAHWRGLTGDYKKQLKAEKRNNGEGGLEDILAGGDLNIGTIIKLVKNNPEILKSIGGVMDVLKKTNQSKLPDYSTDEKGRLR